MVDLKGLYIIPSSETSGNPAMRSPHCPFIRTGLLTYTNPNRTLNMFSFMSSSAHLARKRIFASVYSRSSIHSPRVQNILRTRTTKLIRFLLHQTSASRTGRTGHLVPRNFFRPLGTDIFTAFAFSDAESTNFLDKLRPGANTMQELGMDIWELWHEDKRDSFFFFESQPELKRFAKLFAPHGRGVHARFEAWVVSVMKQYEARVSSCLKVESEENNSEQGVYWRLLTYKNPTTRQPLSWNERASEIMDHMGTLDSFFFASLAPLIDLPLLKPTTTAKKPSNLIQEPVMTLFLARSNF